MTKKKDIQVDVDEVAIKRFYITWDIILLIFGIPANVAIIIYLIKHYLGSSFDRILLMGIAICDILALLITAGYQVAKNYIEMSIFRTNLTICSIKYFTFVMTVDLSFFLLCILSIWRVIQFKYPVQSETILFRRIKVSLVAMGVIHIFIKAVLGSMMEPRIPDERYATTCQHKHPYFLKIHRFVYLLVIYVILFVCDALLMIEINKQSSEHLTTPEDSDQATHMAYLLIGLSIILVFFTLPYITGIFLITIFKSTRGMIKLVTAFKSLMYSNNAMNFWAFFVTSRKFQEFILGEKIVARFYPPAEQPVNSE